MEIILYNKPHMKCHQINDSIVQSNVYEFEYSTLSSEQLNKSTQNELFQGWKMRLH